MIQIIAQLAFERATPPPTLSEDALRASQLAPPPPCFLIDTAALAPGPITPTTSICRALLIAGNANADAVLQATTSNLIPCAARKRAFSTAYLSTVASDFVP